MKKVIGILGGMGPGATVDAFSKLVMHTPAKKDQEHIPVVISSLPGIPDRTECIIAGGPSPLPGMLNSLRILEAAGANCIIMPCNTAHFWYSELEKSTDARFLNIIDAASRKFLSGRSDSVAILATTATIKTELYQSKLSQKGVSCIIPDEITQGKIMQSIMHYKAGNLEVSFEMMLSYIEKIKKSGVNSFIMGCTEIPLILNSLLKKEEYNLIDATDALIEEAVNWFYNDDTDENEIPKPAYC